MSHELSSPKPPPLSLGASARTSLLWGGGFTVIRDVAQFATMLALVRLLTPTDYGSAALAQSIMGLFAVVSFGTLAMHALQARNPDEIDWDAHFTAAVVVNSVLAVLVLALAWVLSSTGRYDNVALPLAALSLVFIVEIPGTLRHRMVQAAHDWPRFRLLLIAGSLLGSVTGVGIALLGGGVWALVVQPVLFGIPAAFDLIFLSKWRPTWSWSWPRYRATARFSAARMGSSFVANGRLTVEQSVLAGAFDFAALGIFTRSVGLATLVAGRIGATATTALYPVITRAEQGSPQFQRYAGLVLRGVAWATAAAAIFLSLASADVVTLLYGAKWSEVTMLLPPATASVGLLGIAAAANALLLANNAARACLMLDLVSGILGVGLAFLLVPRGMQIYLAALAVHGAVMLGLNMTVLWAKKAISTRGVLTALVPAAVAGAAAAGLVLGARAALEISDVLILRLGLEFAMFSIAYVVVLRLVFSGPLRELLAVSPGGLKISGLLLFRRAMKAAETHPV